MKHYEPEKIKSIVKKMEKLQSHVLIQLTDKTITVTRTVEGLTSVVGEFRFEVNVGYIDKPIVDEYKGTDSKLIFGLDRWAAVMSSTIKRLSTK